MSRSVAAPAWAPPALLAAALAALWLLAGPRTPDLAAQVFRTGLFEDEGFTLYNLHWFAGHHTPGYSLLFPPLAALAGPRVVAALAAVVSAALFARLAHDHFGERARAGSLLFAAATATDLVIGRLTFALGLACGLGALLALARGRTTLAVALAVATTASSPVAGLFLAMAGIAHALARRRPQGLYVAAGAFAPALLLAVAFPEGGAQPFGFWSALCVVAAAVAVWRLLPGEERTLRTGALLYAASTVAAFAISSPMGSNATRVAATFAAPVLVCALATRARPLLLGVAVVPLLIYQWWGPVREVRKEDPSAQLSYYRPLLAFLGPRMDDSARVEVPFTRMHWESVHVARRLQLARGWEAQLDRKHNDLFRPGRALTAQEYELWLRANGVRYVALPDVELDPMGRSEGVLIRRGAPFLTEVWSDRNWRVFAVDGAPGLVDGRTGAKLRDAGADWFVLDAGRAGPVPVRVRWTPYWRVTDGAACVERDGDWTVVRAERPGAIRVATRFDPRRVLDRDPACDAVGARR